MKDAFVIFSCLSYCGASESRVDIVLVLHSPQLTACVHGAAALLLPMYWQHIFIPVLPPHLLDYCWYG